MHAPEMRRSAESRVIAAERHDIQRDSTSRMLTPRALDFTTDHAARAKETAWPAEMRAINECWAMIGISVVTAPIGVTRQTHNALRLLQARLKKAEEEGKGFDL